MADGCLIFLWTALLCTSSHIVVGSFRAQTVAADHCGSEHRVDDNEVFRVVMPTHQMCLRSKFTCAIHFERGYRSDSYNMHKKLKLSYENEICVDYSRIRLRGSTTRFIISADSSSEFVDLTSKRYPLIRGYMNTVECYSGFRWYLTLTFTADCAPGASLRDYFKSWIYVYTQLPREHVFYYLDGTCRHTETLYSETDLTVRSVLWTDTADEPDLQTCSLELEADRILLLKLCTTWDLMQTSCEVSVLFNHFGHFNHSRKFACDTGTTTHMDTCVQFGAMDRPSFQVIRNKTAAAAYIPFEDGSLLFEVEAVVKKKVKQEDKYDTETGDDSDSSIVLKVLFPLAMLFSICCCLCGVARKRAKAQQPQSSLTPAVAEGGGLRVGPHQHTGATTPLTTPPRPEEAPDPADWGGRGAERMDAPPPVYRDLGLPTPRHSGAYDRGQNWAVPDTTVPLPASVAGGNTDPPPPPISDGHLDDAPPAYHELFPSHT